MVQYSNFDNAMENGDHFKKGKRQASIGIFGVTSIDCVNRLERWKILIPFLSLMLLPMACTQRNSVRGYIEGLNDSIVLVTVFSLDNFGEEDPIQDTILSKNGQFKFSFPNDGAYGLEFCFPQFYARTPDGNRHRSGNTTITLFTEPDDKISFKGGINEAGLCNITVSGSRLNRDFSSIQNKMYEINKNEAEEEMAFDQAMTNNNREEYAIGFAKRQERRNARRELYSNYIKENLDNPLSALLLYNIGSLDSVGFYYDKLGETARNSIFRYILDPEMERYKEYVAVMKAQEEVIVGSNAPDFTLEDMDGKPFSLSSLRGKYVIIDFWGSWCAPCISGIPKMKSAYEKHKAKLEILGVACNESSVDIWRNTIKHHELPWINVYNDKLSAVNVKYGIESYPTKIVINPEGTILILERGEGDGFYAQLESIIN